MSLTQDLNSNLGLIAVVCSLSVVGIVLYRSIRIIASILISEMIVLNSSEMNGELNALKKFAKLELMGGLLHFVLQVCLSLLRIVIVLFKSFCVILVGMLPFVVFALILALVQEQWNHVIFMLADILNGNLGSSISAMILAPLNVLDVVGSYVLPIYNLVILVFVHFPITLLRWFMNGDGAARLMSALSEVSAAGSKLALAGESFGKSNFLPSTGCTACVSDPTNTACLMNVRSTELIAQSCLKVAAREMDLVPVFNHLKAAAVHSIISVGASCNAIALIANLTLFPLTDDSLWLGVDRLLNFALGVTIIAPSAAAMRCSMAGGFLQRPSMCTPDFAPSFATLSQGFEQLGDALTHWLDSLYVLVFDQKTINEACSVDSDYLTLWMDPVVIKMFGTNTTILVRMTALAFAITDGTSTVYVTQEPLRRAYAPNAWPYNVNPKFGVARVGLPSGVDVKDGGVGLFGCSCADVVVVAAAPFSALRLQCAMITRSGDAWLIGVEWSLAAETQLLTCARTRIVVQSIRWYQPRVAVSMLQPALVGTQQTLAADVAVYAIPVCGAQNGMKAMACFSENTFMRGICFPYCMGLRMLHEGVQPITMRGASEWTQGVVMAMRDCTSAQSSQAAAGAISSTTCSIQTDLSGLPSEAVGSSASCTQSKTCTSAANNRTLLQGYALSTMYPTFYDNSMLEQENAGVSLILNGQPLVVGGGVQMRSYQVSSQTYFDFPSLVGNSYNEFTIESNLPLGAPISSDSSIQPKNSEFVVLPSIDDPPQFIQIAEGGPPYNPGTLSESAFWYATNPSYDWISAFAQYCASKGEDAETQIMMLSSYVPLRFQRIRYQDGACFISSQTPQQHVCAPDLFSSVLIPDTVPYMSSSTASTSSNLYELCSDTRQFNLWVEHVEYFDPSNIVIAVRRGTLANLAPEAMRTGRSSTIVFYFVKTSDASQIRPNIPWDSAGNTSSSLADCPALRVLPNVGAVLGNSLSAASSLVGVVANFMANPFAIMELLAARAAGVCPNDGLAHTSLQDCGMGLVSLDPFFNSVYAANTAAWDALAWIVAALLGSSSSSSSVGGVFSSFLDGAAIMGDATHVVAMFDIERMVQDGFNTGAQELLEGRRRVLLMAEKSKPSVMSSISGHLKMGMRGFFSLTKVIGALASMSLFGGADFGALLSSQDPRTQLGSSIVTGPPIAWAQFTYSVGVQIVIDTLAVLQNHQGVSLSLFAPLWLRIHEAADQYESIVDVRLQRACAGLRLMLGYSSSFAGTMYYGCMSGVAFPSAVMRLASTVFVDVALYRCLCVHPAGQDYLQYVNSSCLQLIPPTRMALWQQTLQAATTGGALGVPGMCSLYLDSLQTQAEALFDDWAFLSRQAAQNLASFMDEILVSRGTSSSSCSNVIGNPTAAVFTPLPIAHYRMCGTTMDCKARCADPIALFEAAVNNSPAAADSPPNYFNLTAESPFFNRYATTQSSSSAFKNILAMASVPAANGTANCLNRCTSSGRCMAVLLQEQQQQASLTMTYYCIPDPNMLLSTVFPMGLDSVDISVDADTTIVHADLLWKSWGPPLILVYTTRARTSISVSKQVTTSMSHEVHLWRPDGEQAHHLRLLSSDEDLTADVLTLQVQAGLFDGQTIARPVVTNCQITSIFPVLFASSEQKTKKLSLFLSFSAQIQGFVAGSPVQGGYLIHAILNYPDIMTVTTDLFIPKDNFFFFVPCPLGCVTSTCGGVCNAGLDATVQLAQQGVIMMASEVEEEANTFLFLPSSGSQNDEASFVVLDSAKGLIRTLASFPMNTATEQAWTRGDIFASIAIGNKLIRDSVVHTALAGGAAERQQLAYTYFFQVDPAQRQTIDSNAAAWLQEIRPSLAPRGGFQLLPYKSAQTVVSARVSSKCTYMSCSGCASSTVRLLCAAAQNCVLANCIGTVVQMSNILCSVGSVLEQTALQAISTWQALYAAIIEIMMLVMRGISGADMISGPTMLKFPTEQFYSLVCSCKDMYASVVGLLMAMGRVMGGQIATAFSSSSGSSDMSALVGEDALKTTSLGAFAFNIVTGGTLLPTLALHRWLLCIANASYGSSSSPEGTLTVEFGDISMDPSWLPCAQMGGLSGILNADDMAEASGNAVQVFVSFVLSMMSGLGDTILYGMQLSFDSTIDYVTGLVWNLQDILYSFNLRSCKVPNYAMRYAMQCSCGDEAYRIPQAHREQTVGALWCVGTLSMTLADGSYGIIYNPYSLNTLSRGVAGVTAYIDCLSSSSSSSSCAQPSGESQILDQLVAQGVEPIAVWARCKSNYALSMWDIGAGALFSSGDGVSGSGATTMSMILEKGPTAIQWAKSVSPELLACLQDPGRLQMDYSSCLVAYFSAQNASNPNAYFVYEPDTGGSSGEPPDACLLFSGLVEASSPGSPLNTLMKACSKQEDVGQTTSFCDLNALGWSGQQPLKVAVAGLHGVLPSFAEDLAYKYYDTPLQTLKQAFADFNKTYLSVQAPSIDAMLFSADGDFIHNFFDCMFLGPYTRIDAMPCDAEGQLECPFYARDEEGGRSRQFTPCFGAVMHGDEALPYTCGSQARRAIIKYYFRDYSSAVSPKSISSNISSLIKQQVDAIYLNYTNRLSFGCGDRCLLDECGFTNGYAPCMSTSYTIPANVVGESLIEGALSELDAYYTFVHTNTSPWMKYYAMPNGPRYPFQWGNDPTSAFAAQRLSHFDPSQPLVTYGPEEVYTMTSSSRSSMWSTCMALVGHPSMSLPLDNQLPMGIRSAKNGETEVIDMANLDEVEALITNVTLAAMESACPFVWHRDRRHAPSVSSVCGRERVQKPPSKLMVGDVTVQTPFAPLTVRPAQGLTFPLYGFLQSRIGDSTCICATVDPTGTQCVISPETCASYQAVAGTNRTPSDACRLFSTVCNAASSYYSLQDAKVILQCLMEQRQQLGVRCPELGPSDFWGLFPAGCSTQECPGAAAWASTSGNIKLDGARFLTEGRAGLRLPNYKHVNDTYHEGYLHYGVLNTTTSSSFQQARCFDPADLQPADGHEEAIQKTLFPAAQLLFDSPVVAVCSRYVVEVARNAILGTASSGAQALSWRRRCEAKIRHLARCSMAGAFYDMAPPTTISHDNRCGLTLMLPTILANTLPMPQAYVAPTSCVVVDRVHRKMYDGPLCAQIAGRSGNTLLSWDDLSDQCLLNPQPLSLLQGDIPYSMVYMDGQTPLSDDWLSNLSPFFDLSSVDQFLMQNNMLMRDHISHVLDWWPKEEEAPLAFKAPPGYHPTAASDPDEFAPMGFDSHFLYDPDTTTFFYAHSAARNGSLVFDTLGAAGVCRAPNVGMPMFVANTNRVCTRMPLDVDTPHLPVSKPKGESLAGYAPEACAESHKDIPWMAQDDDPQSQSVGGIQGWQRHAAMDDSSATLYASGVYPNGADSLTPLQAPKKDYSWGGCSMQWGAGIRCDDDGGDVCPTGMTCIFDANISGKVCYSSSAAVLYQRQPCFRSQHCPDGMVCLADGGCFQPRLHIWNRLSEDIEIAVVADDCGFQDQRHPYTQSARGASPWEQVPDLLHAHGFCSHHNWFSYRQALWTRVCPVQGGGGDHHYDYYYYDSMPGFIGGIPAMTTMVCANTSNTRWPWIFERFDLERADLPQSMASGRLLLSTPHVCDESYMHLQSPDTQRRLQVCSGNQGYQERPVAAYNLSSDGTMPDTTMMVQSEPPQIARWLRTYDEESDALHIGVFGNDLANDVPLGFLGASASLSGVMGDMADGDKVHFFRCGDRLACSNPTFTYNGRTVERLDPTTLSSNFSEVSLRKCGAIGYLATHLWPDQTVCWLEIEFFPIFMQVLWGQQQQRDGCSGIWTRSSFPLTIINVNGGDFETMNSAVIQNSPTSFFCETSPSAAFDGQGGRCAYAARPTTRISSSSQQDSVVQLANALNQLVEKTADAVISLAGAAGPTRAYEHINRCVAQLMLTVTIAQAPMQQALDSWGPSGIYYSLLVTLYEFPIAWLHHAMLVSLLSSTDPSVPKPALSQSMKMGGAVPLFLWSEEDKGTVCRTESLEAKPVLWTILCKNIHPAYTFDIDSAFYPSMASSGVLSPDAFVQNVHNRVANDIQNEMPGALGSTPVSCFTKAAWPDCGDASCMSAMVMAYNNTCHDAVDRSLFPWLDPCQHPQLFNLLAPQTVNMENLYPSAGEGIDQYLKAVLQRLMDAAGQVANPVEYILEDIKQNDYVSLARVWPGFLSPDLSTSVASGFNFSDWLQHGVCSTYLDPYAVCTTQYDVVMTSAAAAASCLYSTVDPPESDTDRYLLPVNEPVITIVYLSGGTDDIRVCDIINHNNGGEACFVQHAGTSDMYTDLKNSDLVPCDIASIEAPPGVEIQAFAISETLEAWWSGGIISDACGPAGLTCPQTACVSSPPFVSSCSWHGSVVGDDPIYPIWNSGTQGLEDGITDQNRSYLDGFGPLSQDFTRMKHWWPQHSTEWRTLGCGGAAAVCAIRVRLEQTLNTRGVCGHAGTLTGPKDATLRDPPNCKLIMNDILSSAFRMVQDAANALYRCAPCTMMSNLIAPAAPAPTYFGCYLDEVAAGSSSTSFVFNAMQITYRYLADPLALLAMFPSSSSSSVSSQTASFFNGTAIDILAPLLDAVNPAVTASLLRWGQRASSSSSSPCYAGAPAGCWAGYDINYFATDDAAVWNKAVQNPSVEFTMTCRAQRYTQDDAEQCNPVTDSRRAQLADFAQAQYRNADGVWMHIVPANTGVAWPASVASSRVGMFSVIYASSQRPDEEVLTRWILGDGPCRSEPTAIQDRICVESVETPGPFEPVHPWLGGDFNPFQLLDECESTGSLCPCTCSPRTSCDANPNHNYSDAFMANEFPVVQDCLQQSYPRIRTMQATDESNLCSIVRSGSRASSSSCQHNQDMFGGALNRRPITSDELHGDGVPTTQADFLIQGMYDAENSLLWAGQTLAQASLSSPSTTPKYAFLRMPREYLHPAHIAFAHNLALTGQPLVIAGILLLDGKPFPPSASDMSWIASMHQDWAADAATAGALYPQLSSSYAGGSAVDWSCPLRAVAFWGAKSASFSPLIPHPPFAALLYKDLGGAHPLIRIKSLADYLSSYSTTNGACFYETSKAIVQIDVLDTRNPCGLYGSLTSLLNNGNLMLSTVMNSFADRCNRILDTPDIPATLRSGEETTASTTMAACGALHRLTPFKMRIKGDAALVYPSSALTTRDEGGDCHMGRMLVRSISDRLEVSGKQCVLVQKNASSATASCPLDSSYLSFRRVAPLSLDELLAKPGRRYRMQGLIHPKFVGPGGVDLQDAEFSFGLLYSTSLKSALAGDLRTQGCSEKQTAATGAEFLSKYATRPDAFNCSSSSSSSSPAAAFSSAGFASAAANATVQDEALWNASNWAWSFYQQGGQRNATGTVNRQAWLRNRFSACHESYLSTMIGAANGKRGMAVKPVTLCEPSPTPQLQAFCRAMLQYRTDIANINCQLRGGCLFQPGAFYVPYMWSTTNQEFAADTVNTYYESILKQPRFSSNESFARLCPARNKLMQQLIALSRSQAQNCPAYQIEYLKNILSTVKMVGNDLLYMGYCLAMYCVNVLAAVFAVDAFSLSSMLQLANTYLANFIDVAAKIIMPILNALVQIIFGTSSVGKLIGDALHFLCDSYNYMMANFFVPSWCVILRPAIYTILETLRGMMSIVSGDAANQIQQVIGALVGNGVDLKSINSCLGNIKAAIPCGSANELSSDSSVNASAFLTQALATRCWSDLAASSVLGGGISAATYLSCTASDTCATEPLGFDGGTSPLIPCASCPLPTTAYSKAFGCDTYLSRCTCGVQKGSPAACSTTSDCSTIRSAICAVSSHLETAGTSMASMACSQCGSVIGMLPTCVDGTCACANVAQAGVLQACSTPGQAVSLLQASNGMCLASQESYSPSLLLQPGIDDWTLDLSTLSLVSCSMGISNNLCLKVQLPLASGAGQYAKPFVVIFSGPVSSQQQQHRRRLLVQDGGVGEEDLLAQFNGSSAFCQNALKLQLREEIKWCLHWHMVSQAVDSDRRQLLFLTWYSSLATMAGLAWRQDARTLSLVLHEYPPSLIRSLALNFLAPSSSAESDGTTTTTTTTTTTASPSDNNNKSRGAAHARRRLLQQQQATPALILPSSCLALQAPLRSITDAFYDTVRYYRQQGNGTQQQKDDSGAPNASSSNSSMVDIQEEPSTVGNIANMLMLGQGRALVSEFLTSNDSSRLSGRRLFRELGSCNFTAVTFAPECPSLLRIVFVAAAVLLVLLYICSPPAIVAWLAWAVLFPMIVLWVAYGVSPLCWPMLPPHLPHDLATAAKTLIPLDTLHIPRFIVSPNCTIQGMLSDGTYSPHQCFRRCSDSPFLMLSWQDPLTWWLCELLPAPTLLRLSSSVPSWILPGFEKDARYFVQVLAFEPIDPDFVAAHRMCAFMTSYQIVFAVFFATMVLLVLPSVLLAVAEIFSAALMLISQASAAQAVE